ncbi:MAG: hypothetical protein JXB48_08920 [Candidatus Latescibacteria bacterium]|nr:hypothetical protein [Candidatus Latescibacterota bacterium]
MKISNPGSNLTAKIVSVAAAILLWFIITLQAPFTYKVSVPIKYIGLADGYVVTSPHPDKALALISGAGRSLLVYSIKKMLYPEMHYAEANLSGFKTKGKHQIDLDKNKIILADVDDLKVESILDKSFFSIDIDKIEIRTVPVDLDNLPPYSVEKDYVLIGQPQAKPGLVVVKGPSDTLDVMKTVKISAFQNNKVSLKDSVLKADLGKNMSNLITIDPETIDLYFSIEKVMQKDIDGIPLVLVNFPKKNKPHFTPDSLSVNVKGPESIVSKVTSDDFKISVRYSTFKELTGQGINTIRPEISFPNGITRVNVTPETVQFSVESDKK